MNRETQLVLLCILPLFLQIFGLVFAVLMDPYINQRRRNILLLIIAMVFTLTVQNYLDYELGTYGGPRMFRILVSIYGYSVRPVIIILFIRMAKPERMQWPFWVIAGVNTAIHSTALFSNICFGYTDQNSFVRGPLGYTSFVVSGILLVLLVFLAFWDFRHMKKSEGEVPFINSVFLIGAVALDIYFADDFVVSFLTEAVVSSCVFYYIWMHLQFAREHEEALRAEQRIQIMISQIQPHFMYNTLATIQALCRIDPEKASETTGKFALYLRQNIDSLSQESLIPLEKELEHTRVYSDIEMIRFPTLRVEYDIEDNDFRVPALTVQPLVENAIRHGVRGNKEGCVRVRTRRREGFHELTIEDNGKGFDVEAAMNADSTHIGLRNVKERAETMLKAAFEITSREGEGTSITIRIPESEAGA